LRGAISPEMQAIASRTGEGPAHGAREQLRTVATQLAPAAKRRRPAEFLEVLKQNAVEHPQISARDDWGGDFPKPATTPANSKKNWQRDFDKGSSTAKPGPKAPKKDWGDDFE
jgi:hypothetical protein